MGLFLQSDSLSVAKDALAEAVPVEKTISIWELLTSGGIAGQLIMISLLLKLDNGKEMMKTKSNCII